MRIHKRGPHPSEQPAIDRQPPLEPAEACSLCIMCWRDLGSCRPVDSHGPGAIPYTAIDVWARRNRVDADNFAMLVAVIHQLDIERADRLASIAALRGVHL